MKYKLPKEFTTMWLAELRANKYAQYDGGLTDCNGGYCCLGVAGLVCGYTDEQMENSGVLSDKFELVPNELIGTANTSDDFNQLVSDLTSLNDGREEEVNPDGKKYSFPEIADWIEQNVEMI